MIFQLMALDLLRSYWEMQFLCLILYLLNENLWKPDPAKLYFGKSSQVNLLYGLPMKSQLYMVYSYHLTWEQMEIWNFKET